MALLAVLPWPIRLHCLTVRKLMNQTNPSTTHGLGFWIPWCVFISNPGVGWISYVLPSCHKDGTVWSSSSCWLSSPHSWPYGVACINSSLPHLFLKVFFFLFFVHLAYLSRSTDKIHLGTGKIRSWNWRWASDWQGARFPVSNISNKVNAVSLWSHTCRQAKRCTEFFKGLCFVSGVPLTAPCC